MGDVGYSANAPEELQQETLAAGGVIALNDYFRAEWPDVTSGYTLWQEQSTSDIVPFAVGSKQALFVPERLRA